MLSLTLKKEYKMCESKNKVLRKIFGPKMDEGTLWFKCQESEIEGVCGGLGM
jgi:hypothetical protein